MTVLTKRIKRELPLTFDRRNWVASIEPWGVSFRVKRSRNGVSYNITWASILEKSIQIAVERARREKSEKRRMA